MINEQGPGKIDWTDYSWNPIAGCQHSCEYCYVKRLQKRFGHDFEKYAFRDWYLKEVDKFEPGSKVFVGSTGDMWGEWVPNEHIQQVLDVCSKRQDVTFQFLTKNPRKYRQFDIPKNCIKGATIDNNARARVYLNQLGRGFDDLDFISFEPLLEKLDVSTLEIIKTVDWIIIGADSNSGKTKSPNEWADEIISICDDFKIPVWIKDNYKYPEIIKERRENNKGVKANKTG
jgi:protein gp37